MHNITEKNNQNISVPLKWAFIVAEGPCVFASAKINYTIAMMLFHHPRINQFHLQLLRGANHTYVIN
jgi:hypothetical protein